MSSIIGIQKGTRLGRRVDDLLPTSIAAMWHQVRIFGISMFVISCHYTFMYSDSVIQTIKIYITLSDTVMLACQILEHDPSPSHGLSSRRRTFCVVQISDPSDLKRRPNTFQISVSRTAHAKSHVGSACQWH